MALRLIEMVLQEKDGAELHELLKVHQVFEHRQLRLPDAKRSEAVLDLLEERYIGQAAPAMGALSLFLMNLICVNMAGVTTFLAQGIRPATWWESDRAAKSTRIAIILWTALLAALIGMILCLQKT